MITLVQTCMACPEQYDAVHEGENVGYLRLRHGSFTVQVPWGGETVYEASPEGDGIFEPEERDLHLTEAVKAIMAKLGIEGDPEYRITHEDVVVKAGY